MGYPSDPDDPTEVSCPDCILMLPVQMELTVTGADWEVSGTLNREYNAEEDWMYWLGWCDGDYLNSDWYIYSPCEDIYGVLYSTIQGQYTGHYYSTPSIYCEYPIFGSCATCGAEIILL